MELQVQELVRDAISAGLLASAHDCSDGGLVITVAESSLDSNLGWKVEIPRLNISLDRFLFAEGGPRIVVSVKAECLDEWKDFTLSRLNVPITNFGHVINNKNFYIKIGDTVCYDLEISFLREAYESGIKVNK